ncbi:MAG: deoxyribonuclease V [Calditrichaceae bacterium]|nr:deoxyribonuclease V [Calditrichaceae bacterium]MBN2708781.1 deoxyribonuclease V [Calditrichaceae bacterium]RQV97689.1 MAG: deoxyribonuclease V [Calditrichota bacterium]
MEIKQLHDWKVSASRAIEIQKELAAKVITENRFGKIQYVAGIDIGFPKNKETARAAVTLLNFPELKLLEYVVTDSLVAFPYVPGLLSFREIPAIIEALKELKTEPDIILCDGQGIAHPRKFGLASHLGLILDKPTIGVAKSRLFGSFDYTPCKKGEWTSLRNSDHEEIGAVLCTRDNVKPLYISIGHKISLQSSIEIVLKCIIKYRLPETTRTAHQLASKKTPLSISDNGADTIHI